MMAKATTRRYTPEEYLALEREAEFKSEYFDGEIYAMAGGSPEHNTIIANVTIALGIQLRGTPCRAFSSDQKVATRDGVLYTYPDLAIVCGEPRFRDEDRDVLVNPTLIVEVLSPTTEAFDRGKKWTQYQEVRSLTDYLLVSQDEPRVEHYARQAEDRWLLTKASGLGGALEIASLGARLLLSEVYDKVAFSAKAEAPPPTA